MKRIKKQKNKLKSLILIAFMLIFVLSLCSCNNRKTNKIEEADVENVESQDEQKYIEETYGIADNPIYGRRVAHTETKEGTKRTTYDEKIREDSKGGSIFYKTVSPQGEKDGLVCVYLSDSENNGIFLKVNYGSYTTTLSSPSPTKNRCYAIVKNDYFVNVELAEEKDLVDDDLTYSEEITIYELNGGSMKEMYTISRELESGTNKLKTFKIKSDSEWIIYAAGYGSYTAEGAEFVSTQQDFCNRANDLLKSCSLDCITLNKTSWNNRWYGMNIDEKGLNEDMVKVDFSSLEPVLDENGDEVTDIVITINDEKQQLAEGEKLEEIEDYPVTYGQNTETIPEDPIIMPENIPQSLDVNDLQDLRYFNIDGFWHSSDYRYVYHIYTQHPDNGFGTLYFADLDGGSKAKHGQVKQTSSYSVILKAMEDNGFSPEVYASNNQLVSDEITLVKADDWIASSIIGVWSDGSRTYTFESDGKYEVKTSDDWYWGKYFIIDENKIVLGEHLDNLRIYDYSLEGNSFILNEHTFVRQ